MPEKDPKSPYVDYKYYTETYHGNQIDQASFLHVELEAEAYVNAITFGRVKRQESVPDSVKNAICAAAECMHKYQESRETSIKSESNDGYAVSYGDPISEQEYRQNMKFKVLTHLADTGFAYKGWSKKYDGK